MASHDEVAHRWAQDDANARQISGFNMFFERWNNEHTIFSYGRHFPVASFMDDAHGRRVVLFTTDGYSVSTSKHKGIIRRAIPRSATVFYVPHVSPMHRKGGRGDFHGDNLRAYLKTAADSFAKAKRARTYGPMHREDAERALREAARYADAFKIKFKVPASVEDAAAAVATFTAKQQRAAEKARKEAERRAAERLKAQQAEDAERFALWRAGEPVQCPASYRFREDGSAYVTRTRYADGEDVLRTSQNAVVPWEHAVRAFRYIALCVSRGMTFQRNGKTIRVGHYQVDTIKPNGDMVAGCHSFAWDEMRALAEREGVQFNGVTSGEEAAAIAAEAVETREGVH